MICPLTPRDIPCVCVCVWRRKGGGGGGVCPPVQLRALVEPLAVAAVVGGAWRKSGAVEVGSEGDQAIVPLQVLQTHLRFHHASNHSLLSILLQAQPCRGQSTLCSAPQPTMKAQQFLLEMER